MRPSHLPSETPVNDNVPQALRYAMLAFVAGLAGIAMSILAVFTTLHRFFIALPLLASLVLLPLAIILACVDTRQKKEGGL